MATWESSRSWDFDNGTEGSFPGKLRWKYSTTTDSLSLHYAEEGGETIAGHQAPHERVEWFGDSSAFATLAALLDWAARATGAGSEGAPRVWTIIHRSTGIVGAKPEVQINGPALKAGEVAYVQQFDPDSLPVDELARELLVAMERGGDTFKYMPQVAALRTALGVKK